MIKPKSQSLIVLAIVPLLVTGLCLVTSGCGGGAGSDTTVTLKPAERNSSGESGGGGETNGGGGEVQPTGDPGTLVGRFTFNGTAPSFAPLVAEGDSSVKDAEYCAAEAVPNQSLVVGPNGGIENVFIYLDEAPKGYTPAGELEPVVLDQKNCTFKPHGLVLQTGQALVLKNDDGAAHNTNIQGIRSKFNSVVEPNDREGITHTFDRPEPKPAPTKCDFHAWMSAYLMIVDHPFAACSKADGTFEIKNLPPGKHTFRVWHEGGDLLERRLEVTIEPGEEARIEKSYGIGDFGKL